MQEHPFMKQFSYNNSGRRSFLPTFQSDFGHFLVIGAIEVVNLNIPNVAFAWSERHLLGWYSCWCLDVSPMNWNPITSCEVDMSLCHGKNTKEGSFVVGFLLFIWPEQCLQMQIVKRTGSWGLIYTNLWNVNFSAGTFGRICRGTVTIQGYNSLSEEPVLIKTLTGACYVASIFIIKYE